MTSKGLVVPQERLVAMPVEQHLRRFCPPRLRVRGFYGVWYLAAVLALLPGALAQGQGGILAECPAAEATYHTGDGCDGWSFGNSICACGHPVANQAFTVNCQAAKQTVFNGVDHDCWGWCSTTETEDPCFPQLDYEPPATPPPDECQAPKPPPPRGQAGRPVSVTTGDMFLTHTDAVVGELSLSRTYNSARRTSANRYRSFGPGWNSSFEGRLRVISATLLEVRLGGGYALYYSDGGGDGTFEPQIPQVNDSWVVSTGVGYQRVLRGGGSESYDAAGRLLSELDPSGVATQYTYDAQNRLTGVTRRGRGLVLEYEAAALQPVRLLSSGGTLLALYSYHAGRLSAVDYPDGSGYRYAYDPVGRIILVRDATGRAVETHEYDAQGRALTSEIAAGREKFTFTYGTNQTTVTDALGNATVYHWQKLKHIPRVTKIVGPCTSCGGGGSGEVQEWTYDERGRISEHKLGADTWTYAWTASDDLSSETDPMGRTTTYAYDTEGRIASVTTPGGGQSTATHGPAGPLSMTEAVTSTESRTTALSYTAGGQVQTVTDPRGKVTSLAYDSTTGDLLLVTDPLGHATSFTYDAFGRRTSVSDALGHTTTTTYDSLGRVTRVTQHDGTHTDFAYDQSGRRSSVTDPLGRVTRYVYDGYENLVAVVDPLNQTTAYAYDLMGQLTSLTDAKGQTTAFEYDGYGRATKMIYPGAGQEVFTYDSQGRLATKTDRKGIVTTYAYDVLGRLTGKTYSDGTTPPVTYTYDTAGRLDTAANGTDTLTWTYDLAGQLLSEQSAANSSTVAYTNDPAGNRLTLGLGGLLFVSYAYDDASRLTSMARGSNVFGFNYDVVNRRTSMSYPNGVTTTYSYDDLNRLLRLKADKGATPITDIQYTHDDAGNRLSKQQLDYTELYGYDPLSRLTEVTRGTAVTRYTYDPVGNRLGEQAGTSVISGTFNDQDQLLARGAGGTMRWRGTLDEPGNVAFASATVNDQPARMLAANAFEADIVAAPGNNTVTLRATDASGNVSTRNYAIDVSGNGATYAYDPNGNLASKVEDGHTWTYEWNAENQLARVTKDSAEVARYAYDPLGRRVEKVTGGASTSYTYDGEDILMQTGGATTVRYVHGPGIDEPLATENGAGQLSYEHADGLGSEIKQTDGAGTVVFGRNYDAFGQLHTGAATAGYAFTGREWDPETGLGYYRARYYDPSSGRFLGMDPVPAARRAAGHAYDYARSNPTSFVDPDGRAAIVATGAVAIAGVAWATICSEKAKARSSQLYDLPGVPDHDKKKHCYVGCYVTRCMLFGPGATFVMTGQVVHEFMSGWQRGDSDADTAATAYGVGMAFWIIGCDTACNSCPVKTP